MPVYVGSCDRPVSDVSGNARGARAPMVIACSWRRALLPLPVLRERAGVRVISSTKCSGDFDHQVLATWAHRVRRITLTLTRSGAVAHSARFSRSTGRGDKTLTCDRPVG